ncbi:hypothetical protein NEOKW01_1785 [Nematocida sp. AWRm80]|nr:hypothetical protein NEOKW01_1785 [Nematocida sp. AWRm80]
MNILFVILLYTFIKLLSLKKTAIYHNVYLYLIYSLLHCIKYLYNLIEHKYIERLVYKRNNLSKIQIYNNNIQYIKYTIYYIVNMGYICIFRSIYLVVPIVYSIVSIYILNRVSNSNSRENIKKYIGYSLIESIIRIVNKIVWIGIGVYLMDVTIQSDREFYVIMTDRLEKISKRITKDLYRLI